MSLTQPLISYVGGNHNNADFRIADIRGDRSRRLPFPAGTAGNAARRRCMLGYAAQLASAS
jgi:hypothetical protein